MTKTPAKASRPAMLTDQAHQERAIAAAAAECRDERRLDEPSRDKRRS
jgi:hypothetical protein